MKKKGKSIKEKRTLNPAVCLLLSAVMAFSSVVTYFADDSISSGDRIVRLTTKDIDGNFTNNDDASKNKYELEIQKTLNTPNELCFEYNVSEFATADDIASEVELVMPNVSFKDSILTVNDANTIIGDPSVVTEGNTARLIMRLNREYVASLDKVVINIPFKITKLSDIGDVIVNLKSAYNQVISYTWNTVLVDTIENPQDLPEFDRFNNGTYFKNASMKVAKGLYHKIPVRVLSKGNEGETLITLEHPSFYFKNYDGTWTLGQGTMKVSSLTALSSKIVDFEVFQIEDTTTPMKLKVNNTNLTSTMQLEPTRIILDTSPTVTTVKVGETNTIDATLKLETPFTANNSFKINIGADSNKFEFNDLKQGTSDSDNKSMQFLMPFKTKKAFSSGIVSLEVVTEFQGNTYEIISKDLTFASNETSTPVEPDPTPETKDYYVSSLQSISAIKNGASKNATFNIVNNSNSSAQIKVKIKSSDSNVTVDSTHLGFNVESSTEYTITTTVEANSILMIPYSITANRNANTGTTDKTNSITFTILTPDDVTSNNEQTLYYVVNPDTTTNPDPVEPDPIDYYVENLPAISPVNNGDTLSSLFTLVNSSNEDASIKVKIKSSDTRVSIESIHAGFKIEGNNEYSITANVKANSNVKIPYSIVVGKTANDSTTTKQNTLTFTVVTQDDITSNNVKTLTYTVKPDEAKPDPIEPDPIEPETKDYYVNSLSAITAMNNGSSRNATFNVVNNSNERVTINVTIKSSDSKVTLSSTHSGFSKISATEYSVSVTVDANSSVTVPYSLTAAKDANTSTTNKQNILTFAITTQDDITSNNTKTLTYTVKPDETKPDPIEPTTKDFYVNSLSAITDVNNGGSRNATFNVVNNSNERVSIMVGITSSDTKVTLSSTHDNFSKVNSKEYRFTATVEANSSIMIPYSIDVAKDANVGTFNKTNSLTFTILTADDITNNNEKVLYYTITPDTIVTPEPTTKDYYIGSLSSIAPVANGASKNSTFNVVNNSDEAATINVNIVSSDSKVTLSSTHEGFAKIGASEYSLMVDVDANSSVMIPYSITVAKDANKSTTDKRNTLTFSIITPDDITSNNVKTLSYIVAPDKTETPDPTPDDPNPTPTTIDLTQYFAIHLITDRTPELNKEVTVAISANKLKDLTALIENPKAELVVTGPSLKDNPSGTYKVTKNLPYIETSVLSSQNISFTPLVEGTYTVTAKVTGTNVNGILTAQKQINIISETGAAPSSPIIGSGKVFVTVDLIDIHDNEATLKVVVTNATDYLLRNVSLSLSYDVPVTVSLSPARSIMKDFYIGEMNKNSTKEFTFPVKVNSTGRPNIVVSLNSTDLNLDVYTPRASYNTLVTYIAEQEQPEKRYKVSGIVFDDINGDGLYSSSDQPISSATVHLKGKVGNIVQTMFSYTSGYYSFSNIVPGEYTIEVNYMGLTSKKKITITDEEQINANIPVLYTYNNTNKPSNPSTPNNPSNPSNPSNPGSNPNTPNNPSNPSTPGNSNNNQQTFYKDVSLIGSLRSNGNNSYIIDLQLSNTNSLPVTDATLKVTAYHAQLQSDYDYIRTSDNSYIIHVPTFISVKELPLYFSAESENARVMIELVCPTNSNTSNNNVSFTLNANTSTSNSSKDSNNIVRGTLKKKISDAEITVKVKSKSETYTLASDAIFELDDKKSSPRKINSAFNDDVEISVKLYRDTSGNVYKVIASSDDDDDETTSNVNTENKLVDFSTTPSTPSNVPNTSTSNTAPSASSAQPNEITNQSNTQESTQTSTIVPVSQSTEEAMYNNTDVTPSLPKTGESSNVLAGWYQMISFVTGFTAVVLFVYAILLKQKQSTKIK